MLCLIGHLCECSLGGGVGRMLVHVPLHLSSHLQHQRAGTYLCFRLSSWLGIWADTGLDQLHTVHGVVHLQVCVCA